MTKLTGSIISICWVIGVGGFTYGYCFACFVTIIGQPGFYVSMGLDPTSTYTANVIGAANALFTAGAACGAIAQGFVADWLGRKKGMAVAAVLTAIGGALSTGSVNMAMIITVRIIQGIGAGMTICLVPLYLAETAPPQRRGFLSGLTVFAFGCGYETCALVSIGSFFATNHVLQWRLPLAMACVGPLLLLALLPLIPESPRYLIWKGEMETASAILRDLHRDPQDPDDSMAIAEFVQISRQVEHDKEMRATYWDIFKRPSWRKRAFLVMFIMFASQSTGILALANFLVLILAHLGLKGVMPLVIYLVWSLVGTVGVIISIYIVDRVGRRILIMSGYFALAGILLAESLLEWKYLGTNDGPGLAACLVFLFLYIFSYQAVDAPSFVWATEVWPTTLRAKGVSLLFFAYFVGAITYTTPGALMIKNIGWHIYLLYMALCIVSGVIVFFFIPETKGLPMEEIAALFGDEVMVKLSADGHEIIKNDIAEVERVELVHSSPKSDHQTRSGMVKSAEVETRV